MLQPTRLKYRKQQKGRNTGIATRSNKVSFGEYAYVNGGLGNAKSIATTSFTAAGLPILDGSCFLHRQASFYQVNWPTDKKIAEDGDVFAFLLPGTTETDPPLLVGGDL